MPRSYKDTPHGADGGTRTRTSVAYYPLKIACLPVPPHLHNINTQRFFARLSRATKAIIAFSPIYVNTISQGILKKPHFYCRVMHPFILKSP